MLTSMTIKHERQRDRGAGQHGQRHEHEIVGGYDRFQRYGACLEGFSAPDGHRQFLYILPRSISASLLSSREVARFHIAS